MIMTMTEKERKNVLKVEHNFLFVGLTLFVFFYFLSSHLANNHLIVLCDLHVSQNNSTQQYFVIVLSILTTYLSNSNYFPYVVRTW